MLDSSLEPPTVHNMATSSRPKRAAAASSQGVYATKSPMYRDSPGQTSAAGKSPLYKSKELRHVVRDRLLDAISKL